MIPVGVQLERDGALVDVENIINEYGEDVVFRVRGESDVTRDEYNSIKTSAVTVDVKYELKAFPIEYQPNQKQVEKAGLRERHYCQMWTATKSWTDRGLDFEQIDIKKTTCIIKGMRYEIKEKSYISSFGDVNLYVTFGLNRI